MPVGEPLPVVLPDQARRVTPPAGGLRVAIVPEKSKLRRSISRWANSSDQHARDLRRTYAETGDADRSPTPPTASGSGCAARCAR